MVRTLLLSAWLCAAGLAWAAEGRFLYVLGCDARVDRVDTLSNRLLGTVDLAARIAKVAPAGSASDVQDGCLALGWSYDPGTRLAHVVLASPGGGERRVALSTVDWRPGRSSQAGGAAPSEPTRRLDLSGWQGAAPAQRNQVIESSAGVFLLRLFDDDGNSEGLALGVADEHRRRLVRLVDLPPTTALNVHLAPGGSHVLVEETQAHDTPARRIGQFALLDARTGKLIRTLANRRIGNLAFLAISPDGRAIYHAGSRYLGMALGLAFTAAPVARPMAGPLPGVFFADR